MRAHRCVCIIYRHIQVYNIQSWRRSFFKRAACLARLAIEKCAKAFPPTSPSPFSKLKVKSNSLCLERDGDGRTHAAVRAEKKKKIICIYRSERERERVKRFIVIRSSSSSSSSFVVVITLYKSWLYYITWLTSDAIGGTISQTIIEFRPLMTASEPCIEKSLSRAK